MKAHIFGKNGNYVRTNWPQFPNKCVNKRTGGAWRGRENVNIRARGGWSIGSYVRTQKGTNECTRLIKKLWGRRYNVRLTKEGEK
ncbi:hypothetical protein POVWA2_046740 [Plasmodium ovale wallikeri]|uniref:Uncharacterized protein n=1 Tax=Plasmodium ovale wallikeri TaxID=864142 RepID=A0A1A8ZJ15_PLAOA|nr:hypothetical protein POVWA2_046740 [Plasmodium ovale wallikeri]